MLRLGLRSWIVEAEGYGDDRVEVEQGGSGAEGGAAWDFGRRGVGAGAGGKEGADEVQLRHSQRIAADG